VLSWENGEPMAQEEGRGKSFKKGDEPQFGKFFFA